MELRWAVKWGEVISYLLMLGNTCHTCCIHPLAWQDSARIHDLLPLMPQLQKLVEALTWQELET